MKNKMNKLKIKVFGGKSKENEKLKIQNKKLKLKIKDLNNKLKQAKDPYYFPYVDL